MYMYTHTVLKKGGQKRTNVHVNKTKHIGMGREGMGRERWERMLGSENLKANLKANLKPILMKGV